ncbi:MAG: succinate dehydrogenase/fumarate reductase iron-sulfur subunit [Lachnospiraceae bacterium]|nr:succinate dehydrogenase/fumarate reductase iron-sulfur subunit [Lachnospiraceae bacterium]
MKKTIRILRQKGPGEKAYFEDFPYETEQENATVATALMQIAARTDLAWEHSCLQKKCGACAMVVDQKPVLACDTALASCKGEVVVVEPLKKFPVVKDLLVDRSILADTLQEMQVYAQEQTEEQGSDGTGYREETVYEAARCLQCGLCLEICPNYYPEGTFAGMAAMAPIARLLAGEEAGRIKKTYTERIYEGCGKSLACRDVCPAGLDMDKLLSRNNKALRRKKKRR